MLVLSSLCTLLVLSSILWRSSHAGDVVYAVNAGGEQHIDSNGIHYITDPLTVGVASDYGKRFRIRRVPADDQLLYQTERWHDNTFSYSIPVKDDGEYVLVLKFSEVYFNEPEQKIFSVKINNNHEVVSNLDIFESVGHGTAHDEIVSFSLEKGKLSVNDEVSSFSGTLKIDFVKGHADNPKVCAFYVMKGKKEDVPALPPVEEQGKDAEDEEISEEDEDDAQDQPTKPSSGDRTKRDKLKSGPPAINPYAEDSSSLILPIIVAFCAFIPALVCLCRL